MWSSISLWDIYPNHQMIQSTAMSLHEFFFTKPQPEQNLYTVQIYNLYLIWKSETAFNFCPAIWVATGA